MDAVHDAIDMLDARAPIAGAQIQRLADEAREAPSRTLQIPFVGRLVWRRFQSELIECARQERLEFPPEEQLDPTEQDRGHAWARR